MCTLEEKAFALFRKESTPEFKRHVLDVVKATIDSSPRITVKRLKGTMETLYFIQPEDVDGALSALLNVYGCITSFRVPERDVIHLNSKPSQLWDQRDNQQHRQMA